MLELGSSGWIGVTFEERGREHSRQTEQHVQQGGGRPREQSIWRAESRPVALKHRVGGDRQDIRLVRSAGAKSFFWQQWEVTERKWWNAGVFVSFCFYPFDHSWKNKQKMIKTGCRETSWRQRNYSRQEMTVHELGWWEPKKVCRRQTGQNVVMDRIWEGNQRYQGWPLNFWLGL